MFIISTECAAQVQSQHGPSKQETLSDIALMVVHRPRRWSIINAALGQCLLFAVYRLRYQGGGGIKLVRDVHLPNRVLTAPPSPL